MSPHLNKTSGAAAWTASDLAAVYTSHSRAFVARSLRYVQDKQVAEDIVQEAFIKVILAAPELQSRHHLMAYLNTTVTNLSLNFRRDNGRAPLLVAVDSETSQSDIAALAVESHVELDADLTRAEDAAIVREAISRLSEADRLLILAVDVAEKSVSEVAAEYGMKEASVHNAVSRARRNLRSILETWVINEETGLTAAQFLSKSYKKAAENSKKIGTIALSLVLLISAFFGFWNNPTTPANIAAPTITTTSPQAAAPEVTPLEIPKQIKVSVGPSAQVAKPTPVALATWALAYLSTSPHLGWPGLDESGMPTGFTVNNGAGLSGLALVSQDPIEIDTEKGRITSRSRFTTFQDGINVILSQEITNTLGKITYQPTPLVRVGGSWIELDIASISTDIKKLEDGTYQITSWMIVDLAKTAANTPIAGSSLGGADLSHIPAVIATRIRTSEIGTPINGQAVQVLDPVVGRS